MYEQLGARRSVPARSEDGEAIGKEEEVFVVRYEKGIAYVRPWAEARDQISVVRDPFLSTGGEKQTPRDLTSKG